jgi:hypothetical protein
MVQHYLSTHIRKEMLVAIMGSDHSTRVSHRWWLSVENPSVKKKSFALVEEALLETVVDF